jgi:hypothetical protein
MSVVSRITSNKRGLFASLAAVAALGLTSTYTPISCPGSFPARPRRPHQPPR